MPQNSPENEALAAAYAAIAPRWPGALAASAWAEKAAWASALASRRAPPADQELPAVACSGSYL